jgi:hypothetical protein
MALSKLVFKPGINRDQTNYASESGWYEMDKVRFRSGFPEKIGGWKVNTVEPYYGVARSLFSWNTIDGGDPISIGTNEKIYVSVGSNLIDITPLRVTYTSVTTPSTDNCFGTTDTTTTVTVTLIDHGATEGAWVTFAGATDVGGILAAEINKEFKIFNVTTDTFDITVATAATSTTTGGGTAISAAFQINIGNVNTTLGYGWGAGAWGRSGWGAGSAVPIYTLPRLIFQDNFNDDLVFNINGGDIYYWVYNTVSTARAVLISSLIGAVAVPQQVGKIQFTSQGFLLALGGTTYDPLAAAPDYLGYFDPLMIRWSNVDPDIGPEPENWQPTLTNSAGFLRLQTGSKIITSISTRQETLIWTDTSLNSLQYLGTAEVFGLQQLSAHTSIIGPNAVVGANNITYWMGNDKFFMYSGRVDTLPCTLRQYIFQDINRDQTIKFFGGSNAQFNEVIWFYCSANATEVDRYVIYNYSENIWYYGQLERTAWVDAVVSQYPLAVNDGWLYFHENGTDDGQPLGAPPLAITSYIQSADVDISDGDKYMLLRRILPDVNFRGSEVNNPVTGAAIVPEVQMTVGVRNFPGASSAVTNASNQPTERGVITASATIDQYTNQVFVRARGRQMNFKISSDTVGTQWQLGMPRFDARPDGTRN